MNERITFQGNPLTLTGRSITIGQSAPDFKVCTAELKPFTLSDLQDKIKVITSFPSIDTPVCDLQVKEFNKRATSLSKEVVIAGISKDLPFAQKRFCDANNIKNVITLSDYAASSFGLNYGLLIKELNLLARAVLILDKQNYIRYIQIVSEITQAPDYEEVVKNLENIIKNPGVQKPAQSVTCIPCTAGMPALVKEKVSTMMKEVQGWQLIDDKKIQKDFAFNSFADAKSFVDVVAVIAEEEGHHPAILLTYNKVAVTLATHAAGGLTQNDFIMAKIIDQLQRKK